MSRRKRLRPWPPPGADLPSLAELERLSWGEGPGEQQAFAFVENATRKATPPTGGKNDTRVGFALNRGG